jgi:hypothetical protein
MMGKLEELGQRLARELEQVLGQKEIRAAIDLLATPAARALRPFFVSFDLFDSTVFPILYGTPAGDSVPVEIIRLSPEDVTALQPDFEVRRRKLKGLVAAHFGAFLDEKWRENDLLWGRLDAAERLITTLLPFQASETLRNQLIDEAQAAIIEHAGVREAIRKMALERVGGKRANVRLTAANADQVVAALTAVPPASLRVRNQAVMENWTTVLPDTMDRKVLLEDLARSAQITGEILDGIADAKNLPSGGIWITRAGRILWGLVELAAPRAAWKVAFRYWSQLLYAIAILLIVGGALSGTASLTQFGWSLLGLTFTAQIITMWLTSFMNGPKSLSALQRTLTAVLAVAALVLLVLGVWHTWTLTQLVLCWAETQFVWTGSNRTGATLVNLLFAFAVPLFVLAIGGVTRLIRRLANR